MSTIEPGPCEICRYPYADPHEWVTRGAHGPKEEWNQARLCRFHHDLYHNIGRVSFAIKYPQFEDRIRIACEKCGKVFDKEGKHGIRTNSDF